MIDSKKAFLFLSTLFACILSGCFPSYKAQARNYKHSFQEADSLPDYSDLKYWAAHPWKRDPSDSIPLPLKGTAIDTSADVFFIHPTTLTNAKLSGRVWNASINDTELNAKTDYTSILYQASVFNGSCRVFAPRYRQAHIFSFFTTDTTKGKEALNLAYQDVETAFNYYLKHYNHGRPIIIAAHSQGTLHAARILKKYFDKTNLQAQLVAAYIVGLPVDENMFQFLEVCKTPKETGCINSWRTFKTGYLPSYVQDEKSNVIVTNPLSWTTTDSPVSRMNNHGAVLYNYNKRYLHTNSAQIHGHVLWTNRPKFLFGIFLKTKNYHAGDYNLFYYSIRKNIEERIDAYFLQLRKH